MENLSHNIDITFFTNYLNDPSNFYNEIDLNDSSSDKELYDIHLLDGIQDHIKQSLSYLNDIFNFTESNHRNDDKIYNSLICNSFIVSNFNDDENFRYIKRILDDVPCYNLFLNLNEINIFKNLETLKLTYLFIDTAQLKDSIIDKENPFTSYTIKKLILTRVTIKDLIIDIPNLEFLYLESVNIINEIHFSERTRPKKIHLVRQKYHEKLERLFITADHLKIYGEHINKRPIKMNIQSLNLDKTNYKIDFTLLPNLSDLCLHEKNNKIYKNLDKLTQLTNLELYINNFKRHIGFFKKIKIPNNIYKKIFVYKRNKTIYAIDRYVLHNIDLRVDNIFVSNKITGVYNYFYKLYKKNNVFNSYCFIEIII